jgi:hypothetical protein
MHVSHPNDSMLSDNTTSDNHADDLEGNLEWFELEGETPEDVRMFNEANPGGIGEEDVPEADRVAGIFLIFAARFWLKMISCSCQCKHLTAPLEQHTPDARQTFLAAEHTTSKLWCKHAVSSWGTPPSTKPRLFLMSWYVSHLPYQPKSLNHGRLDPHREGYVCTTCPQAQTYHI